MIFKVGLLKKFVNFSGQHLCWSLLYWKEIPSQVFSSENCEVFKNTFFQNTSGGCFCLMSSADVLALLYEIETIAWKDSTPYKDRVCLNIRTQIQLL